MQDLLVESATGSGGGGGGQGEGSTPLTRRSAGFKCSLADAMTRDQKVMRVDTDLKQELYWE